MEEKYVESMKEKTENSFSDLKDIEQAEKILNRYQLDNPGNLDGLNDLLAQLLDVVLNSKPGLVGNADSFHNFAVSTSKIRSDNYDALAVVKMGLEIHPFNTDLLADAILYGRNSGEKENCKKWYQSLKNIDQSRWTWRSFSFSIDYLLDEFSESKDDDSMIIECKELAKKYQEYRPREEDAWLSEAQIFESTNQRDKAKEVLKEAIGRFKNCPKCMFRLVDMYIDEGDYESAAPLVSRLKKDPMMSKNVNASVVYYYDGVCQMHQLFDADDFDEEDVDPKIIRKIFRSFRQALRSSDLRESIKRDVDDCIRKIELEIDITYPEDWR